MHYEILWHEVSRIYGLKVIIKYNAEIRYNFVKIMSFYLTIIIFNLNYVIHITIKKFIYVKLPYDLIPQFQICISNY